MYFLIIFVYLKIQIVITIYKLFDCIVFCELTKFLVRILYKQILNLINKLI